MDSLQASRISGGNSATGRRQSDFYPTPPEATIALVQFLRLERGTVVWEPAFGEGDMGQALGACGLTVYGTDIRGGQDFLVRDHPDGIDAPFNWIITNPPFSLAEAFIRHAAKIGKPFAMLLKSQYWHAAKRAQLFHEIPPSYVLPLTWRPDFFFKNRQPGDTSSPLMDVMWCVWLSPRTRSAQTVYQSLEKPREVE